VLVTASALYLAFTRANGICRALAFGVALHLVYVLYIGGDYMMGRFFAVPFFISAWLVLALIPQRLSSDLLVSFFIILCTLFIGNHIMGDIRIPCPSCIPVEGKVIDARYNFRKNGLFADPFRLRMEGEYKFARAGKALSQRSPGTVLEERYIGMIGYYAGPDIILIDNLALADALLARLPATANKNFFVGHFSRALPEGYMDTVSSGENRFMPSDLATYYEKLRIITQGDICDWERLKTILYFNLGYYDGYKNAYLRSQP
jgi:arabinofuranosyltransferase